MRNAQGYALENMKSEKECVITLEDLEKAISEVIT